MRARNIKPGFWKNEDLAECSRNARLLAPGLWSMADREGRLEDRPKRIKAEIFPYDNDLTDVEINLLLDELALHQHITRYEVGDKRFIQINKFSEHQRPHKNEVPSKIPSQELATKVQSASDQGTKPLQPRQQPLRSVSLNDECGMMNDESKNTSVAPTRAEEVKKKIDYPPDFENFWKAYPPNNGSKKKAFEIYKRSIARGANHETIIGGASEYRGYIEATGAGTDKTAHATTWLNEERWTVPYSANTALLGNTRGRQESPHDIAGKAWAHIARKPAGQPGN